MEELRRMLENIAKELSETEDFYEYFEDVLDFEYTIDSRKRYSNVRVWVTLGGPNIWIDTAAMELRGAWGSSREYYPLSADVCTEIDRVFEEYYYC